MDSHFWRAKLDYSTRLYNFTNHPTVSREFYQLFYSFPSSLPHFMQGPDVAHRILLQRRKEYLFWITVLAKRNIWYKAMWGMKQVDGGRKERVERQDWFPLSRLWSWEEMHSVSEEWWGRQKGTLGPSPYLGPWEGGHPWFYLIWTRQRSTCDSGWGTGQRGHPGRKKGFCSKSCRAEHMCREQLRIPGRPLRGPCSRIQGEVK